MRRFLALFMVLLLWAAPTEAAITRVAGTCAGSSDGNSVTTAGINTTGATLYVVSVSDHPANHGTVSDSQSHTWNTSLVQADAGGSSSKLFFVVAASTNASHTFTLNGASTFGTICVIAFSGTHATPYTGQEASNTAAADNVTPGTITPSENNCVVVTGIGFNDNKTFSITGGWTIEDQEDYTGGLHFGGGIAYIIQTTAASASPNWSFVGGSADLSSTMAVFKSDGGGGGGGATPKRLILLGAGGQ